MFRRKIISLNVCCRLVVLMGHHGDNDAQRKRIKYHSPSPIFYFFPLPETKRHLQEYIILYYMTIAHVQRVCMCGVLPVKT